MNQIISNINKVPQLFAFGAALILILTVFQISHPTSASAQVCNPNQWYPDQCARCDTVGGRMGDFGSDYGPNTGSPEWCSCAARKGDTGSLMNYSCPQAPKSNTNPGQVARSCDDLGGDFGFCPGLRTYDRCTTHYVGNLAYLDCQASQNPNCVGNNIRCEAKDQASAPAPANSGQGGALAVVNCPAGTSPGQNSQGTTVCVANANNNSNNNANSSGSVAIATAQGGAGGSASINIGGTTQPAQVAGVSYVKQLPNTGLPEIALASLGLIPLGTGLKGFRKGLKALRSNDPSFIWENRQFKSQS